MDLVIALVGDEACVVDVPRVSADRAVVGGGTAFGSGAHRVPAADLPAWVAARERVDSGDVRWVWADSSEVYALLLRAGVRVRRAIDLRLVHAILRRVGGFESDALWDLSLPGAEGGHGQLEEVGTTLFDAPSRGPGLEECVAEHLAQRRFLAGREDGSALGLLCHAESVGGLIAAELNQTGVPFSSAAHEQLLDRLLGERDPHGGRPTRMAALVAEIRAALGMPTLNPDSAPHLVRALRGEQ
ncbi:hypothetical protein [Ornithinimicrobium sp. Y1694]|uniref:hypothetical protein n=1 Tax=Ornithinimicrobium sp. Y1694 TaxID=3418590 RepID=UPI003CF7D829